MCVSVGVCVCAKFASFDSITLRQNILKCKTYNEMFHYTYNHSGIEAVVVVKKSLWIHVQRNPVSRLMGMVNFLLGSSVHSTTMGL